jgi:hypothetical protein
MSDDKGRPWVPRELRRRPQAEIDAMETDPEEFARDELAEFSAELCGTYHTPYPAENEQVTRLSQALDYVGHTDLAARLVAAYSELVAVLNAATDALGESPYA